MKKTIAIVSLFLSLTINAGSGYSIGNTFYYRDFSSGTSYTVQSVGNFDYVSGSNGYSGFGQRIGNSYYYND